jgi:HSP20 family molecular chaperone IbpA
MAKYYLANGMNLSDFQNFFNQFGEGTSLMKSDLKEKDNQYMLEIEIPGFSKEEIKLSLEDGYLTVTAEKQTQENEEKPKYLHRERITGKFAREFYVGDVKEKDIAATYQNGILSVTFPKETKAEEKKYIAIE